MGNSLSSDKIIKNQFVNNDHGYDYSISKVYDDNSHYDTNVTSEMIRNGVLCPFYPETENQPEECPICFLEFRNYNKANCCKNNICTDCFVQLKPCNLNDVIGCPFCNAKPFAVVFKKSPVFFSQIREKQYRLMRINEVRKQQKEKYMNYQMNMTNQLNMLYDLSQQSESPQDLDDLMLRMALEESLKQK
eukprot:NODE_558_length_6689_cov_0.361912.p3 type:complete len:190 gc:universal NODE_558_length_6689_cov_0.361912:309-878(+)